MMKILPLIILLSFSKASQEQLKKDTIVCRNISVIIDLPSISVQLSKYENYEEGFFKFYPNIDSSYMMFHCGAMIGLPIIKSYNRKYKIKNKYKDELKNYICRNYRR